MSDPKISISTELMKNYKQTLLMSPDQTFEALQTSAGNSLLFSIGTDGVFYVTQEVVGHETGWQRVDLSTAQIAKSFPGATGVICKTFSVGQSAADGSIGLAMVVNDGTSDHLFLCLSNSNSDTSWLNAPAWTQYPFDNPPKNVTVAGVFLSETAENAQYIVVDILRDDTSAPLISRYYINTQSTPAWQPHDVSIDLEANGYTSCLGRQSLPNSPHQPTIDGLYTSGQVDGLPQLAFQPLYDVFNPGTTPPAARLALPGSVVADTIAACRKSDLSTDLYACGGGALYFFASSNQEDGAVAVLLAQNAMFSGVRKMYAAQSNSASIVWGLNGSDQIFYTSCPSGQETASPSAWSLPVPICTGVDMFSPYINHVDDGNTFFAVAGSTLQKLMKSSGTAIWASQSITLPSAQTTDTQKYSSYTTRIQVTDDNNQPLANAPITISANVRTPVFINHLYYVLGPASVQVNTDVLGSVTVVQWVTDLTGAQLTVAASSGQSCTVNPMDGPMAKIAQLNTAAALSSATITNDDGSTRPLVASSVSNTDLQAAATANGQLGVAYGIPSSSSTSSNAGQQVAAQGSQATPTGADVSGGEAQRLDAGDLFRWLETGVEAVVQIVMDIDEPVWYLIAAVDGITYTAVLDVAEKIVAAVTWVFSMIETAIEDLISALEYLFCFQDILLTHRVMKNVITQWVGAAIAALETLGPDLTAAFTGLQNDVDKWANIPAFEQTPGATTASNPTPSGLNSAPAQLGIHHYQGGVASAATSFNAPSVSDDIFQDLLSIFDSDVEALIAACDAIWTDVLSQLNSLSLTQIIERVVAILTDTLLQQAENILVEACNVFVQLTQGFMDLLSATIDIPVLSWLYKDLTGDNLSLLDLFCLIAAIPATIVYKIAYKVAPFAEGDAFTIGLLNASNFDQVRSQFFTTSSSPANRGATAMFAAPESSTLIEAQQLQVFGRVAGIFALVGSCGLIVVMSLQRISGLGVSRPVGLASIYAIANVFYLFPNIQSMFAAGGTHQVWWQILNYGLTVLSLFKGALGIKVADAVSSGAGGQGAGDQGVESQKKKYEMLFAGTETVLNAIWFVPVIMSVIDHEGVETSVLVVGAIGNSCFNAGGIMELPIQWLSQKIEDDPETAETTTGVWAYTTVAQYSSMFLYGLAMAILGFLQ